MPTIPHMVKKSICIRFEDLVRYKISGQINVSGFCGFSQNVSGFCGFSHAVSGFCGFSHALSGFCGFSHALSGFCGFSHALSGFCGFSHAVTERAGAQAKTTTSITYRTYRTSYTYVRWRTCSSSVEHPPNNTTRCGGGRKNKGRLSHQSVPSNREREDPPTTIITLFQVGLLFVTAQDEYTFIESAASLLAWRLIIQQKDGCGCGGRGFARSVLLQGSPPW